MDVRQTGMITTYHHARELVNRVGDRSTRKGIGRDKGGCGALLSPCPCPTLADAG